MKNLSFTEDESSVKITIEDAPIHKMSFDELRKRARQLENEIDSKLVEFSKLATNYGSSATAVSQDQVPLLSGDGKYETMCLELDRLLGSLSDVNEKLNNASANGVTTAHTIQRHRDILQDYTREFQRTNSTIKSRRERDDLLSSSRGNELITGVSRRDLFLKEDEHITNSERLIDEQISIALDTRDHLKSQRQTFKFIQTKVNDITNRFPVINSLMSRINIRRRRDAIVIGTVVGLCLTFMFWWMAA